MLSNSPDGYNPAILLGRLSRLIGYESPLNHDAWWLCDVHHHHRGIQIIVQTVFKIFQTHQFPYQFLCQAAIGWLRFFGGTCCGMQKRLATRDVLEAWQQTENTALKFNMELKNHSIEKEHHLPYLCFFRSMLIFQGVKDSARCHQHMTKQRFLLASRPLWEPPNPCFCQ